MITAERLHGRVVDYVHRLTQRFRKVESDPAGTEVFRLSRYSAIANRRGEPNRDRVEFPISDTFLESCHELVRLEVRSRIKLPLIGQRHEKFHMGAANVDDKDFFLHERPPDLAVMLLADADAARQSLEYAFAFW